MDIRQLRYFSVLADELHFGRAAGRLCISQPPLSRAIKLLEEELGVQLFERGRKGVALTRYGRFLKTEADNLIAQADSIKNRLDLMANQSSGFVRIGYMASIMYVFLPRIVESLKQSLNDLNIFFAEKTPEDQVHALRREAIEFGFMRSKEPADDLVFELLADEPYMLIFSEKHRLAGHDSAGLKDFAADPLVTFTHRCSPMQGIKNIFDKAGVTPTVTHRTGQINTMLRLVESNAGWAVVPASVLQGYDLKIRSVELSEYGETTPIYCAYRKQRHQELSGFLDVILQFQEHQKVENE